MFEEAGYDTTDFLTGITTDELTEIGVSKPGHKKKLMTALSTVHHKEHLMLEKPVCIYSFVTSLVSTYVQFKVCVACCMDSVSLISLSDCPPV